LGLAKQVRIETADCDSNDTVEVFYQDNEDGTYTSFDTNKITTNGITTYTFATNSGKSDGLAFRKMRFKFDLAGGASTTSPDVLSFTFEYYKKLPAKYGFTFEVDMREDYGDKTPQEQRAKLISAVENSILSEFTFRDDDGGTRNYAVDVISGTGLEKTGRDETGFSTVTVVEI